MSQWNLTILSRKWQQRGASARARADVERVMELSNGFYNSTNETRNKMENRTFKEILKAFSVDEQKKLTELEKQVTVGLTNTVKAGEAMHSIQLLLAKPWVKGAFSAYLREKKILRQTAYNWIGEYNWSKVPAQFKQLAEAQPNNATLRNLIIAECAKETPSLDDAKAAVVEHLAEKPESEADPIEEAIAHATKILVAAFKGNIETVAILAAGKSTAGYGQGELDATGVNIVESVQKVAQKAFDAISKAVDENKLLKGKGMRLPVASLLAMAEKQPGPKHLSPQTSK